MKLSTLLFITITTIVVVISETNGHPAIDTKDIKIMSHDYIRFPDSRKRIVKSVEDEKSLEDEKSVEDEKSLEDEKSVSEELIGEEKKGSDVPVKNRKPKRTTTPPPSEILNSISLDFNSFIDLESINNLNDETLNDIFTNNDENIIFMASLSDSKSFDYTGSSSSSEEFQSVLNSNNIQIPLFPEDNILSPVIPDDIINPIIPNDIIPNEGVQNDEEIDHKNGLLPISIENVQYNIGMQAHIPNLPINLDNVNILDRPGIIARLTNLAAFLRNNLSNLYSGFSNRVGGIVG